MFLSVPITGREGEGRGWLISILTGGIITGRAKLLVEIHVDEDYNLAGQCKRDNAVCEPRSFSKRRFHVTADHPRLE